MFNHMYGKGVARTPINATNRIVDIKTLVEPYAVDVKSGKVINKSNKYKLVKTGQFDIYEKIQSYKDDCDIYKILEKFAVANDPSLINQRIGSFGDFTNIPDNVNEFNSYVGKYMQQLKKMDKDVATKIINDNIPVELINQLIDTKVKAALADKVKKDEVVK